MPPPYDTTTTASELIHDYTPLIHNKTILITGVSPSSLGSTFVQSLASATPRLLILASRNPSTLLQTASSLTTSHPAIEVRTLQIDLGSLPSVRDAAAVVNGWEDVEAVDVLVNNAGIMAVEYGVSGEGFESHLATNHLGPFLFTNLIMGKICKAERPRVVMVSSDGHRLNPFRFDDYNFDEGKTYNKWSAYGQSKTANMLMAISLAEKLGPKHKLLAFSLHPGVIWTNLGSHLDWSVAGDGLRAADRVLGNREGWAEFNIKPLERGVATHIYASFDPELEAHNGAYLIDSHVADPLVDTVKPWATSSFEAERLWKLSEKLVGEEFAY
ncbi:hypothetical protein V493_06359 [Pseudogymnoascus sp. VKM F-4281 (FW-2241)]|nr:hypothetical protein V493_06359 [Pseudogymnoascus sp. VKM F-4281 (FW-2241)]